LQEVKEASRQAENEYLCTKWKRRSGC